MLTLTGGQSVPIRPWRRSACQQRIRSGQQLFSSRRGAPPSQRTRKNRGCRARGSGDECHKMINKIVVPHTPLQTADSAGWSNT